MDVVEILCRTTLCSPLPAFCRIAIALVLALSFATPASAAVARGWTPAAPMATGRDLHAAVVLDDGKVLVAGGETPGGGRTASAELFDPATGAWSSAGSMLSPRSGFALVKLRDGTVLAAGGVDDQGTIRTSELYDPARNTWVATGDLQEDRYYPAGLLLGDGTVLLTGGAAVPGAGAANTASNSSELYNPATRRWTRLASTFGESRFVHAAAPLPGGGVLVAGGADANYSSRQSASIFSGGVWQATTPMATKRLGLTLNALPDGRVLAAGGSAGTNSLNTTELFEPGTRTWQPAPPMTGIHDRHNAVTLVNGQVLVVGGFLTLTAGFTATAELFDPAANAWTSAGTMQSARAHMASVLLGDGRVLVTGGFNGNASRLVDVWTPTASLTASPGVTFSAQPVGTTARATVSITNTSDQPLLTEGFAVAGGDPADFSVNGDRCRLVAAHATCVADVAFTPSAAGARGAALTFAANTAAGTHAIPLSGAGVTSGADGDGDGVADIADRCKTLKGPAGRQGCPKGLLADPSIRYEQTGNGIRVIAYYVKATSGAKVTVRCSKRACKTTRTTGKGSKRVRIGRLNGKRLKNGTTITITVADGTVWLLVWSPPL